MIQRKKHNRHLPLILVASAAVFLLILYFALVRPLTRAPEDTTAPVTTGPGEGFQYNRYMLYDSVKRVDMLSIKVHNKGGTYEFRRVATEEGGSVTNRSPFVMHLEKNGEMVAYGHVAYNEERFSELVVATGTFYYMRNLANDPEVAGQEFGPENWADYGLAPEDDPAWFEIALLSGGEPIRVYVGDAAITGNGYYVRVAGRDNAVYVSHSNLVGETALKDLPSFVDPALTVPLVENGYYYNKDVTFWREVADPAYRIGAADNVSFTYRAVVDGVVGEAEYTTVDMRQAKDEITAVLLGKALSDGGFSYTLTYAADDEKVDPELRGKTVEYRVERIERIRSLYIALDFVKKSEQSKFFAYMSYKIIAPVEMTAQMPSSARYMDVLEKIGFLSGSETVAVGLDADVLKKYGLGHYVIYYETPGKVAYDTTKGKEEDVLRSNFLQNYLYISKKQEDGTYYVASVLSDVVAKVDGEVLSFLEQDDSWWLNNNMVSVDVQNIKNLHFSFNYLDFKQDYEFRFVTETEGESTRTTIYYVGGNKVIDGDAFSALYQHLLTIDYSGAYDGEAPTSEVLLGRAVLTMKMTIADEGTFVYRFYPYSTRHHLVSVAKEGDPEGAYFYVLAPEVEKTLGDVKKLIEGVTPDPEKQY